MLLKQIARTAKGFDHGREFFGGPAAAYRLLTPSGSFQAVVSLAGHDQHFRTQGHGDVIEARLAYVIAQEQDIRRNTTLYPPGTSSRTRNLATQWIVGYVANPFTSFYAGYSNGYLGTGAAPLETQQRTFFLKASYDFQL